MACSCEIACYIGIIDVPDFGVRDQRDFDPLITEEIVYKAQGVLSGKVPRIAPLLKRRPDFPLRGFVRCAACECGLTGRLVEGTQSLLRLEMTLGEGAT